MSLSSKPFAVAILITLALPNPGQPQSPAAPTGFQTFAIKPHAGTADPDTVAMNATRIVIVGYELPGMIGLAWDLKDFQVIRPKNLDQARYDLSAATAQPVSREAMIQLLQAELVKRFNIVLHHESKTLSVYQLVAGKGAPKLTPASVDTNLSVRQAGPGTVEIAGKSTLTTFADLAGAQTDRPGVDKTGIAGIYDFKLDFAPEGQSGSNKTLASAPSLFTAIQTQLGLKFESARLPIDVLVVDRANRTPTGN